MDIVFWLVLIGFVVWFLRTKRKPAVTSLFATGPNQQTAGESPNQQVDEKSPSIFDMRQPLQPFRMGDTLNRFLGVLSRSWLMFTLMVSVAELPVLLLDILGPHPRIIRGVNLVLWVRQHLLYAVLTLLLALVLAKFAQAIVVLGVLQGLHREKIRVERSVSIGLARGLPVMAIALLIPLIVGFGLAGVRAFLGRLGVVLVIPLVVYFLVATLTAVPVCVIERAGPLESLWRSWELTRGSFWVVFGVVLLFGIPYSLGTLLLTPHQFGGLRVSPGFRSLSLTAELLSWLWKVAFDILEAAFVTVLYRDLRLSKEGVDAARVVDKFEQRLVERAEAG